MNDLTQQRLITNALWVELKRVRWRGPTSTRDLDEHGCKPPYRTVASGRIPRAQALNSTIRQTDHTAQVLIGTIHPDERLGTTQPQHVILHKIDYLHALHHTSTATCERYALALAYKAGDPYAWHVNGRREWTLQKRWDAWLTPDVLAFLHRLAGSCQTTAETPCCASEVPHLANSLRIV